MTVPSWEGFGLYAIAIRVFIMFFIGWTRNLMGSKFSSRMIRTKNYAHQLCDSCFIDHSGLNVLFFLHFGLSVTIVSDVTPDPAGRLIQLYLPQGSSNYRVYDKNYFASAGSVYFCCRKKPHSYIFTYFSISCVYGLGGLIYLPTILVLKTKRIKTNNRKS